MPLRSVLARAAPASAISADSGYVSAAARPASATAPTPAESLATARRLGHDFARLPAPGSSRADVLQRQDSDDEDDDPSFVVKEPAAKRRKTDPNSAIEKGSIKKTATSFKYKTVGGAKHKETYADGGRKKTTRSKNLRNTGPQHRNNAQRPAKGEAPKVFNPYGLSVGQQTLNQLAVSHSTPSWAGFRAGGQFANSSLTSPVFNSNVEKKEKKKLRPKVENIDQAYDYETQTEYEELDPKADPKRILPLVNNPRWDEKRISTRLERLKKLYPKARRIASERRTLTYPVGKKRKRSTFNLASDLHYGLPRRAYDKEALKKYIEARGQDSEGSDDELEEKPKKKAKKVVVPKKAPKKKAATKKAKKKTK